MSKRWNTLIGALGAASGLAAMGYVWLFRRPLPREKGWLSFSRLKCPVEIFRDRWGVPHIYAQSSEDLLFAQGYVHAQERLWQMDFNRRLVAGRLSEILGSVSVPLDRWMRILGMRRVAEVQEKLLDGEALRALDAYTAGVNARIAQAKQSHTLPVEFSLLRYTPEPWKPSDSLGWAKMMAWNLSVNWETEILRAQLIANLGADQAAELEPLYFEDFPSVVPPGMDYSCIGSDALKRASEARRFTGPAAREGLGSNNWVISPSRSQTGMPLLANDMHLGLTAPAIWFENHLDGGDYHVTGVSFPGVPGVIAGHNEHVAWGFTNGFPDVQDLYIEKLQRTEDGGMQYLFQDEWRPAEVLQEKILVKGEPPVTAEVVITHHGPVINDLAAEFCTQGPLALRWTALEPDSMILGLLSMDRAKNCLEFREALRHWSVPVQNMVYADVDGNIAYSFPGKVPVRASGDGRVPVPGWTGEYEWTGYIPFEELPHLYNPPQGFIATANNRVVGDDYPYFLGYDHVSGNRAQRIVEMIEEKDKLGLEDIIQMQMDQVSPAAHALVSALQSVNTANPAVAPLLARMQAWDGRLSAGSPEAAIYEVFVTRLISRLLSGRLDPRLAACYAGKGITPVLAESSLMGERSREWLRMILNEPDSPWFNQADGKTRDELLCEVLQETRASLEGQLGPDPDKWAWGSLHRLTFLHPLGSVKPLNRLFNRGPYPIGGDYDTVWNSGTTGEDPATQQMIGPPFRFIADLSNWNNSRGILVPGQSGHPGSPHYADNVQAWFRGESHPMLFDRETVEAETVSQLVMGSVQRL